MGSFVIAERVAALNLFSCISFDVKLNSQIIHGKELLLPELQMASRLCCKTVWSVISRGFRDIKTSWKSFVKQIFENIQRTMWLRDALKSKDFP